MENKHAKILDIGAGKGHDLMIARGYDKTALLHGIEIYEPFADELREKNIIVHSINIERDEFPFDDESTDIVIANQILEHVKEVYWLLHEISRVLRVGGHFIIGVPNLASLHNRFLLMLGRQPTCIQNNTAHVRGYTKRDMLRLLNTCFKDGYDLELFGGSNFYPLPSVFAKPLGKVFPNLAWGIFLLLKKRKHYISEFLEFPVDNQLQTNFYLGEN
jgi:SAM-dependent methyltransferase